jgi:hypothetical protein
VEDLEARRREIDQLEAQVRVKEERLQGEQKRVGSRLNGMRRTLQNALREQGLVRRAFMQLKAVGAQIRPQDG